MKQTVNFSEFHDGFLAADRMDNFSYKGLRALFDYLEDYEEQCETEIEFDVIALCCDYSELSYTDVYDQYLDYQLSDGEKERFKEEDTDQVEFVQNYLNDNTMYMLVDDTHDMSDLIIIQAF